MAGSNQKKINKELREYALSFPEAKEDYPWGERVVKVKGKVFVFLGREGQGCGVSVKLPESSKAALTMPFTSPTPYGLGKAGWVNAEFEKGQEVPVGLVKNWIHESYCAVAPKKLLQQLAADGAASTEKARARPARRKKS
jgi:predicted DNA-binding protein (MmcQ/YjbR family)